MLNEQEKKIFETKMKRFGYEFETIKLKEQQLSVSYWNQENFSIAIMIHDKKGIISVGITKRNPIDQYKDSIGIKFSFARAIDNYEHFYKYEG